MNSDTTIPIREPTAKLPSTAPIVRITAGTGSVGQKTWNLRRPVTLIGSRRPAHIVLHDSNISKAHCVIVNTGTDVLLKDLHTSGGTVVNRTPADLMVLSDGDIIRVGATSIQVAIRTNEEVADDSEFDVEFDDPIKLREPVRISLVHTDQEWLVSEAVTLIGRHGEAGIRLDHPDVSGRHAIIFRFGIGPAVFDLGSRSGVIINGQRCTNATVADGDRLTIGPFGLAVGDSIVETPGLETSGGDSRSFTPPARDPLPPPPSKPTAEVDGPPAPISPFTTASAEFARYKREASSIGSQKTESSTPMTKSALVGLEENVANTWELLNSWQSRLETSASELSKQETDLQAAAAELEIQDAAVRGRLHDVTRITEQVAERERELADQAARNQEETNRLAEERKRVELDQADNRRRDEDFQRRESAMVQRWTRMRTAKCPACGEPMNRGTSESIDA